MIGIQEAINVILAITGIFLLLFIAGILSPYLVNTTIKTNIDHESETLQYQQLAFSYVQNENSYLEVSNFEAISTYRSLEAGQHAELESEEYLRAEIGNRLSAETQEFNERNAEAPDVLDAYVNPEGTTVQVDGRGAVIPVPTSSGVTRVWYGIR